MQKISTISTNPRLSALVGFVLVLPFFILNFIVVYRLEPIYSFLGSVGAISSSPWFPTLILLLFPVAFFVVIRPMINKGADGKRKIYLLNLILGALIFIVMILLIGGLSEDIIACNFLNIPNCD